MNKSKESGKFFATIQQVGKSFFLPVSVLPIAGLLLGLGSSFTNQTTIETYHLTGLLGSGTVLNGLLIIMSQVGTAIFGNLPLIRSVTDALYEKNWKIYSLKNYWVNDSFPYNGVNAKFKNSRNYRIEIQFHTQESFDVKMSEEDHKLYEQRRVLEPGCDEYNRILQLQLKLYSDMEYPENIADLEKI